MPPNVPYTCEPCKQKHNSARSSCLCGKCDDDIKQNWISCDVCQTWYHQKCVGIDESAEQQEYICPKVIENSVFNPDLNPSLDKDKLIQMYSYSVALMTWRFCVVPFRLPITSCSNPPSVNFDRQSMPGRSTISQTIRSPCR